MIGPNRDDLANWTGDGSVGDADICITMGTLADILSVLRRERARLFAKYGLKSMAVFGSATRDDFRPDGDVDILIEVERPIGIGIIDLEQDLERIVSRKVDVVMRKAVKPHYLPFIEKDLKYV
jgi:predicted nucleotidyltransferase